jgi:Mg2+-importing ATPase
MALLDQLHTTTQGLSDADASAVRRHAGVNEVHHEKPLPAWRHLWQCFRNPFNLLLSALALISWLTEDMKATVVISAMVGISTLLRFVQEARSNQSADRLRAMVSNTATVLRPASSPRMAADLEPAMAGARRVELPMRELVPGDLVALSAGDMIPADCRVLMAKDLFVSQSALTGEALPVEKFARDLAGQAAALERDNHALHGHQRHQRHGRSRRAFHRRADLLRCAGAAGRCRGPRHHCLPGRHQPRQLVADPLHAGHGAAGAADQWLHQG